MKISLILFAVFQSLWSIEAGILSFRYAVGLNLFQTFLVCFVLSIFDLTIYYYLAEHIRRLLGKLPYFKNWLGKIYPQTQNHSWIKYCYRWRHWGLFLTGFIPHLLLVGIAAQKLFQFKNGYWPLFFGTIAKVAAIACGLKILEYLAH